MARVLYDGLVEFDDGARIHRSSSFHTDMTICIGTPATTSQMAKDVATFLSWAAEPEHDERKKYGIKAVIIFSALTLISLYVKRFKWSVIKNRKICRFFSVCTIKTDVLLLLVQHTTLLQTNYIRSLYRLHIFRYVVCQRL